MGEKLYVKELSWPPPFPCPLLNPLQGKSHLNLPAYLILHIKYAGIKYFL
jgi:hypothetical protein